MVKCKQLANEKEVVLVQGNGGVVRNLDPDAHIKQTFNRQKGGKALKFSYDGLVGRVAGQKVAHVSGSDA